MSSENPSKKLTAAERRERGRAKARRSRQVRIFAWLAAAVAVVVAFAVVSGSSGGGVSVSGTAAPGEPAPDVRLTDFDGKEFTLADLEGKPLVVNFWATWCPFCVAEMPGFEKVHQSVKDEVAFLGIDQCETCQGGSLDAARDLAKETGVTYRLAEDPNGSVFVAFGGSSMPTTLFINEDGEVVERVGGMLEEGQLRDLVERLFGVTS